MKMEISTINAFPNMCRTCMKALKISKTRKKVLQQNLDEIPVTSNENKIIRSTIMELLYSVQPKIVTELDDELPSSICMECVNKLLETYDFLKTYRDSDFKYRQYLKCIHQRNKLEKANYQSEIEVEILPLEKWPTQDIELSNDENYTDDEAEDEIKYEIQEADELPEKISETESMFENMNGEESELEKDPLPEDNENNSITTKANRKRNHEHKLRISKEMSLPDENDTYPCTKCNVILDYAEDWLQHMQDHEIIFNLKQTSDGKYQCEYCDKEIATKRNYLNHMEGHTNTSTYICETCGKAFTQILKFQKHKREHFGKRYPCKICGKVLKTTNILTQHMRRHTGEKTKQCTKCPKKFFDYGSLYQHMSVHATEKPFVCDICEHKFSFAYLLRNHEKRFHGNRRYECEECDMSYSTSSKLKRHMFTHDGIKPAKCKFCNRSFTSITKRHLRTHLGDQIYLCDLCPKRFPSKRDKVEHFASHKDDNEKTRLRLLNEREQSEKTFYQRMGLTVMGED